MLAAKEVAPGPSVLCRDVKTGEVVSCTSPDMLVMVLAGMSCMLFLVSVVLFLLCWTVVKQRRQRREQEAAAGSTPTAASAHPAQAATAPVDSSEIRRRRPGPTPWSHRVPVLRTPDVVLGRWRRQVHRRGKRCRWQASGVREGRKIRTA